MDPDLNPTTAGNSLMYQAIEDDKLEDIKLLLENGSNVNEPIITTGELAGFTALHVACMKNKDHLVELLVDDYKADVNAMAVDGTQPIHLACFYEPLDESANDSHQQELGGKIQTLVEANANVNAEFGREIFAKHVKDREWCPEFGDKMPLVAYTVIYNKPSIINLLKKVNIAIISITNKTLLTYAVENGYYKYSSSIISNIEDPVLMDKLINHRDNDDVPPTHYLFHPKKYGKFRYLDIEVCDSLYPALFLNSLVYWGADIYALINNDPATFLPNILAYRSCPMLLKSLLPYYTSMSLSRVLYYATLPIDGNSEDLISYNSENERSDYLEKIRKNREKCIKIALEDLVFRGAFRLPVPQEEIKLMDELIASDENLRTIVDDFKRSFIDIISQDRFIEFRDNKMTSYDFLMQVFDHKKLKFLAREENSLDVLDKVLCRSFDEMSLFLTYYLPITTRLENAKERLRHLENLKKISSLREAIPLPFELILEIVEYLKNKDLKVFIKAFYSS